MRWFSWLGIAVVGAGAPACQSVSVRPLETAAGPAVEVRCRDAAACGRETARITCQHSEKVVHSISQTQWVVTCEPSAARSEVVTRRPVPPRKSSAASARKRRSWDDGLGLAAAGPTRAMLQAADHAAAVEHARSSALTQLARGLAEKCRAGNLDSCVAALDLTPWSRLPAWSETPTRELRVLEERFRTLLKLCEQRHAAACHRLGELAYTLERGSPVHELSVSGALQATLERALRADPRFRARSAPLAATSTLALQQRRPLAREQLAAWSTACVQGVAGACLLGATQGWSDADGYEIEVAGPPVGYAELPVSQALSEHCQAQRSLCTEAREHELAAGRIGAAAFCSGARDACGSNDPHACFQLATAVANSTCPPSPPETLLALHQKACALGSSGACSALVQPSLDDGNPSAALGYALAACQVENELGCRMLANVFGNSRRFTHASTGHQLLSRACSAGHLPACHDVYLSQYLAGSAHEARQNLFKLCTNHEHVRSCRAVAQLDWVGGRAEATQLLLERQCLGPADDLDSCIEFGALLAHRGERPRALSVLTRTCQRHAASRSLTSEDRACRLTRRIEAGFVPQALGDIFLEPILGGRDTLE
ncbi:MAG TPA: hypothetical protein VFU02_00450 [Polyangiaceae bacterium]|nr:hypothetical protein [Polyangiaceae bacterium]